MIWLDKWSGAATSKRKPVERLAFFFLFKLFAVTNILIRKFIIKSIVATVLLYAIYLIVIFTYPNVFPNSKSLVLINKNDVEHSEIIISGESRANLVLRKLTIIIDYFSKVLKKSNAINPLLFQN